MLGTFAGNVALTFGARGGIYLGGGVLPRIADRLRGVRAGRTTVVTTTSPLVLDRADQVVLLVDGRVHAVGTHHELLRENPDYRSVVTRDVGDEEEVRT